MIKLMRNDNQSSNSFSVENQISLSWAYEFRSKAWTRSRPHNSNPKCSWSLGLIHSEYELEPDDELIDLSDTDVLFRIQIAMEGLREIRNFVVEDNEILLEEECILFAIQLNYLGRNLIRLSYSLPFVEDFHPDFIEEMVDEYEDSDG